MSQRRAQLLQFKQLMQALIQQLREHDPIDGFLGFNDGMIRELHRLAGSLGWCRSCNHPSGLFHVPVSRRDIYGITMFDAYSGGSAVMATIVPLTDDKKRSLGAKLKDGYWNYSQAASRRLASYQKEYKELMIPRVMPLLQSWLTKVEVELVVIGAAPVQTQPQLPWLVPAVSLVTLGKRFNPPLKPRAVKKTLLPFGLRNEPPNNHQRWTVRLDQMAPHLREIVATPHPDEKK
jgi:hypothetical protein